MSIRSYLASLKQKLEAGALKPVSFVTGNQSADLDSVISAISYSYLANIKNPSTFIIPLINIPRNELRLRRDIVGLLGSHSISDDLLYFTEDFASITKGQSTDIILVDHCNIQGALLSERLQQGLLKVTAIIDHHADEGVFVDASPRIVHSNGSCSSLVFNYWFNELANDTAIFRKDPEVVELLLGPLLIDTSNMTQKVEEGDIQAIKTYKEILQDNGAVTLAKVSEDEDMLTGFYKQLKTNKKDLSGFSFQDVLLKDYKQFKFSTGERVGFSSIGKSLKWVLTQFSSEELKQTLAQSLKTQGLDLLVITSSYTQKENDQYTREFCYYFEDLDNNKFASLDEHAKGPLELNGDIYKLNKIEDVLAGLSHSNGTFKLYNQAKLSASRKQVVPIVKEIIERS
ncbi:DHH phosphoesterase [Suhomyces tanzawaensis NRRL Y-17324]|uniref:DHH phosphoesterase n=1 Tax=Suhomyces tanzawaensis NRRL Y-17324 TaxID=984487 RepID=A0A1E4SMG6_9ASCO|nr:DHH phosphoesterase [Suhomyces tanzawaensis NRRL Y-17324]ODV80703.1 DHH phosphoesterase [Suhomyces tanzawaensis NRRL Y-17324]